MATIQIQCTDTRTTATVLQVFRRGLDGQPDTLLRSGRLGAGGAAVDLDEDCYVLVHRVSQDQAKSIDNW